MNAVTKEAERVLRERAKRLGYRLHRRSEAYRLIDPASGAETEFGGPFDTVNWLLDVIEYKLPVQFSTACGIPLWTINDDKAT
jgi:hypothetical protein